ncbi:MAG: transglycosylase SLT domain-containing protein [Holosporales bacterium]|nr:transglycosylase SLT domain-containing protein [Holosporales bacterium]
MKRCALAFGILATCLWPEYFVKFCTAEYTDIKQLANNSLNESNCVNVSMNLGSNNNSHFAQVFDPAVLKDAKDDAQENSKNSSKKDIERLVEKNVSPNEYGVAINHRELPQNSQKLQLVPARSHCAQSSENSFDLILKKEQPVEQLSHMASLNGSSGELPLKPMTCINCYGLAIGGESGQHLKNPLLNQDRKAANESKVRRIEDSSDCIELTRYFEKKYNIPDGLLLAIANVESTRRPWAVNNFKESRYFDSLDDAVEYIRHLEKSHQLSISVGFMQVNWAVHKSNFKSIREAFTPFHNVEFAAKLLVSLYLRFGSWEQAIMWYNPCGTKPNYEYLKKIRKNCNV